MSIATRTPDDVRLNDPQGRQQLFGPHPARGLLAGGLERQHRAEMPERGSAVARQVVGLGDQLGRHDVASLSDVRRSEPRDTTFVTPSRCSVRAGRGEGAMADHPPQGSLRLAELVAALSLGVDLGFGQPMEHVLRQSRIALRLAELAGLGRRATLGRLLHLVAGQRRLPFRRARAGEVVRRRHRDEVAQVRPSAAQRRGRGGDAAAGRAGTTAAGPVQGRAGVRGVRRPRPRRHDQQARGGRAVAGLRARAAGGGPGGRGRLLRAVGRAGLARCACGVPRSRSLRDWPSSRSSSRSPTG